MIDRIDLNELAKEIAYREGQKVNLPIAQVKEVLRITCDMLCAQRPSVVLDMLERYQARNREPAS